jgi:hypothetical protein
MVVPLKWVREGAGRQVTLCGRYAVAHDGFATHGSVEQQDYDGVRGNEWAAIDMSAGGDGENLDWFDTMREAKAMCEDHARTVRR